MSRSERTDGGVPAEGRESRDSRGSPFHTTADVEESRSDRVRALADEYVAAPTRIVWNDLRVRIGFAILFVYLFTGTVGVALVDPPAASEGPLLLGAFQNSAFPLGTDGLGQDIFASLVHATRPILQMIAAGALFSTGLATVWGTVAGYKGGQVDRVLMTIADIVMTIPGLPLIIVLAAILQPESPYVIGIILSSHVWAGFARKLRSQVLTIRENSYVEASRTMGLSTPRIVTKDILPNVMPYITVNFVSSARRVIIASVGLYFLGVLGRTTPNWGTTMQSAYNEGAFYDMSAVHWFLAPMVAIVVFSLGLILLGQGLDRVFNPRIRARHAKTVATDEESVEAD